jgi:large subunit ribosomal protein L4
MEFEVITREGASSGKMDLPDNVFAVTARGHVLHEAVRSYLTNQRQGTRSTKGRSEVKAGGRKPWRQKGLGRARSGSAASPIWVGGGVAHGPKPYGYRWRLPKKARRLAIRAALSMKARQGELKIVESLGVSEPKTKRAVELMRSLGVEEKKCLFVLPAKMDDMIRATNNIPGVKTALAREVNVYDILDSDMVVIDKAAVAQIAEVLGR